MPETDIKDGFDEIEHKFPGTKKNLKRYGSPFFPSLVRFFSWLLAASDVSPGVTSAT